MSINTYPNKLFLRLPTTFRIVITTVDGTQSGESQARLVAKECLSDVRFVVDVAKLFMCEPFCLIHQSEPALDYLMDDLHERVRGLIQQHEQPADPRPYLFDLFVEMGVFDMNVKSTLVTRKVTCVDVYEVQSVPTKIPLEAIYD